MNKRIISLLLALVTVLSLTACGKPSSGGGNADGEQITLRMGVSGKSNVSEWDNNALVLWLEEQSGYNLEIEVFSADKGERATQIATMVAGGEPLPDVMCYFALNQDLQNTYGKDGYLLDLLPYFKDEAFIDSLAQKYDGFNYVKHVEKNCEEDVKARYLTEGCSPEGQLWAFPSLGVSQGDQPRNMLFINQSWLDKLGLEMPTNIEELTHVLTEFVTKDPNGNGKADEMGMVGSVNIARGDIPSWLINNYIYLNDNYMANCTDDGQIYLPYDRDEYRQGVKAVHEMYEKGLIAELTWTIKEASELPALFSPADEVSKIGVWAGHPTLRVTAGNPTLYEYTGLLPFEGAYAAFEPLSISTNSYVSGETEYPEEAFEILYLLSTPEGQRRQRYGEYGVDWEWAPCVPECEVCAGKGINGDGMAMKIINSDAYTGQTTSTFANYLVGSLHLRNVTVPGHEERDVPFGHFAKDPASLDDEITWSEYRSKMASDHAKGYMAHADANNPKNIVNKLNYTTEETELMGNAKTDISTYAKEMRAKFITGEIDINDDAVWDNYVKTIHSLNWDNYITCVQAAWDRKNAG
ncbi:MAG: extracellular solute-binding protein [Oscillospiraceae bacterium]|nr:extracellular solute-binding protein [Oscillospiraceae bacterium]